MELYSRKALVIGQVWRTYRRTVWRRYRKLQTQAKWITTSPFRDKKKHRTNTKADCSNRCQQIQSKMSTTFHLSWTSAYASTSCCSFSSQRIDGTSVSAESYGLSCYQVWPVCSSNDLVIFSPIRNEDFVSWTVKFNGERERVPCLSS